MPKSKLTAAQKAHKAELKRLQSAVRRAEKAGYIFDTNPIPENATTKRLKSIKSSDIRRQSYTLTAEGKKEYYSPFKVRQQAAKKAQETVRQKAEQDFHYKMTLQRGRNYALSRAKEARIEKKLSKVKERLETAKVYSPYDYHSVKDKNKILYGDKIKLEEKLDTLEEELSRRQRLTDRHKKEYDFDRMGVEEYARTYGRDDEFYQNYLDFQRRLAEKEKEQEEERIKELQKQNKRKKPKRTVDEIPTEELSQDLDNNIVETVEDIFDQTLSEETDLPIDTPEPQNEAPTPAENISPETDYSWEDYDDYSYLEPDSTVDTSEPEIPLTPIVDEIDLSNVTYANGKDASDGFIDIDTGEVISAQDLIDRGIHTSDITEDNFDISPSDYSDTPNDVLALGDGKYLDTLTGKVYDSSEFYGDEFAAANISPDDERFQTFFAEHISPDRKETYIQDGLNSGEFEEENNIIFNSHGEPIYEYDEQSGTYEDYDAPANEDYTTIEQRLNDLLGNAENERLAQYLSAQIEEQIAEEGRQAFYARMANEYEFIEDNLEVALMYANFLNSHSSAIVVCARIKNQSQCPISDQRNIEKLLTQDYQEKSRTKKRKRRKRKKGGSAKGSNSGA